MEDRILLAHGSGGKLSQDFIHEFLPELANPILNKLDDSAVFELNGRIAFTTDSYTVNPIFFHGGDIGRLAVCGTVNDLSMSGAKPLYLSLSFIIEEGLLISDFKKIVTSIKEAAEEAAGLNTGRTWTSSLVLPPLGTGRTMDTAMRSAAGPDEAAGGRVAARLRLLRRIQVGPARRPARTQRSADLASLRDLEREASTARSVADRPAGFDRGRLDVLALPDLGILGPRP